MQRPSIFEDKGYSEERCLWCGWTMGNPPLNCNNDDTPHVFRSTLNGYWWSDKIQALLASGQDFRAMWLEYENSRDFVFAPKEHHCGFDFTHGVSTASCSCGAVATNPYYSGK